MAARVENLAAAVARALAGIGPIERDLDAADAQLGDGDTGGMIARVIGRMAATDLSEDRDMGVALTKLAKAAAAATGSSLGTLVATGFLTVGKAVKGREEVPWGEWGPLLATARDAMAARGGAALGDKTVLDGLDAVAEAIGAQDTREAVAAAALSAGRRSLVNFRDRPCRMGRARLHAERSVGRDDPGMLALVLLMEASLSPEAPAA
ncbi:MAG: dihydroxyacetone kinase subunit L [Rhodospirillum sp.]|nr:dihydroxyacetone kinase subunit L [Rhodospirillum sp.]MCF8488397.1 dihydroxyacetone kinase subunit L [Rhodospirillum sp.]MCF8502317.1 dihydroxyacetone kinase subunit L [Rhodospirillum sp.]